MAGVASKVELSISCLNLKDLDKFSKSDPVVFLFEKRGQQWIKMGRTEVLNDNLNPKVLQTVDYPVCVYDHISLSEHDCS